jgi:tetratricopeptide (TPR) repeat protein
MKRKPPQGPFKPPLTPSILSLPPDAPRLGRFILGETLGSGQTTVVNVAADPQAERWVAIKRLRPEGASDPLARERLVREAKALGPINHRGVMRLLEAHLDGPEPYLVLELVRGRTLEEFSRLYSPLPPPAVMVLLFDLAQMLIAVHEPRQVHRDLHPSRVIIDPESVGRLVLSGFGRVAFLAANGWTAPVPGEPFIGRLGYASPEQMLGLPLGTEADQFSLSVLGYVLLTGRLPFAGPTVEAQLELIRRQDYLRPRKADPRVPPALDEVLERGLLYEPTKRWPDMASVARELARGLRRDFFEAPAVELGALLAEPSGYLGQIERHMVVVLQQKALTFAAQGDTAAAVAECQRAQVWRPGEPALKKLESKIRSASEEVRTKMRGILAEDPVVQARVLEDGPAGSRLLPSETGLVPEPRPVLTLVPKAPEAPAEAARPAIVGVRSAEGLLPMKPTSGTSGAEVPEPRPARPATSRRRWAAMGVAAVLVAVLGIVPRWRPAQVAPPSGAAAVATVKDVLCEPLTSRPMTGRFNEPSMASYLPPPGEEGTNEAPRVNVDPEALGQLEKRGAHHAAAIGELLKGGPGSEARAFADLDQLDPPPEEAAEGTILKMSPPPSRSPDIDSERALVFLRLKAPSEAFRLASRALLAEPAHPAARWNQALALQDLTLTGAAATVFGRIQAAGEPGWSQEAGIRLAMLQAADEAKRRAFEEMRAQGRAMVAGGPVVPELVDVAPGHAQLYFYDGVRAATSAARALEFLPLAEALDRRNLNHVLERYVRRVAATFSVRRAQLAGTYAQLAAHYDALQGGALEDYFARLRAAGEDDMLVGAMILTLRAGDHLEEFQAAAQALGDPWFDLLAENEVANVEMARGEVRRAEERLLAGRKTCVERGPEFRCIRLDLSLIRLYISLLALPEAEAHAEAALEMARKTGDMTAEATLLGNLSEISVLRNDPILSRAYLDESALREPGRCERQRFVHVDRAVGYLDELRFEEARREILAAPLCGEPRSLTSLYVMTHLDRVGLAVAPWAQLRGEISTLRRQGGSSPGRLALATYLEGLLVLPYDRQEGRALLTQSIAMAKRLTSWDVDARHVLLHAYQELSLDHAKAGETREALATLAGQQGLSRPSRCVVGALVPDERSLVLGLDARGAAYQHYEARRSGPDIDVARLVPDDLEAALHGCPHVEVFAPPPIPRGKSLLPSDILWSFRWGAAAAESAKSKPPLLLVVRDPQPPSGLGLEPRAPWKGDEIAISPRTILEGGRATPAQVLEQMRNATEVLFDVPCLTANEEFLALSVGSDGRYALTASMVLRNPLAHGPVVALVDRCSTGSTSYRQDLLSLAMALRWTGAKAVFYVVGAIPEGEGREFLGKVLERTRTQDPAAALHEERLIWRKRKNHDWVHRIVLMN